MGPFNQSERNYKVDDRLDFLDGCEISAIVLSTKPKKITSEIFFHATFIHLSS
jgi:hypothetical protein